MEIFFATSNSHKVSEAAAILGPLGHRVQPLLLNGRPLELVEPQAEGIEEVARSKLEQAVEATSGMLGSQTAILVEDSGLFVRRLTRRVPGPILILCREHHWIAGDTLSDGGSGIQGGRIPSCSRIGIRRRDP